MSAYANPERPEQRLSDAERDAAVGHLAAAQSEGRLNAAEYQERADAARSAVTRGDLVPLFADLPDPARSVVAPSGAMSAPVGYPEAGPSCAGPRALGGRVGATIMALVPFLAVGLFFLFGFIGSFAWSWLWFLLIPVVGIVIYGPGSDGRRAAR